MTKKGTIVSSGGLTGGPTDITSHGTVFGYLNTTSPGHGIVVDFRLIISNSRVSGNGVGFDTYKALYKVPGFVWGETPWIHPGHWNTEFCLPSLWDPKTEAVSTSFFQSGVNKLQWDLVVRHIVRDGHNPYEWKVGLQSGYYFINNQKEYLFSDSAIPQLVQPLDIEATYTQTEIQNPLEPGRPIEAFTLERNSVGVIQKGIRYRKKDEFTGKVVNGTRQSIYDSNGEYLSANLDPNKYEFTVDQSNSFSFSIDLGTYLGSSNTWTDAEAYAGIPEYDLGNNLVVSYLGENTPVSSSPIIFSKPGLFKDRQTSLGAISNNYDYYIDENNYIYLRLDSDVLNTQNKSLDLGIVTFQIEEPSTVTFNRNCVEYLEQEIGVSIGSGSEQVFYIDSFPLLDLSTETTLDNLSLNLYVVNPSEGGYIRWTRVSNLDEYDTSDYTLAEDIENLNNGRVYTIDCVNGYITFGGGSPYEGGAQAPTVDYKIYLHGYQVPLIMYEPEGAGQIWHDTTLSLNPLQRPENSGFLCLLNYSPDPVTITLEANQGIFAGTSSLGPVSYTNSDIWLTATVTGAYNEPLTNHVVTFYIFSDLNDPTDLSSGTFRDTGYLVPVTGITNAEGKAYVRYQPPYSLSDYSQEVPLYNAATTSPAIPNIANPCLASTTQLQDPVATGLAPYGLSTMPYSDTSLSIDTLSVSNSLIPSDISTSEMYLFSVLDNDEVLPYNTCTRTGGVNIVWYRDNGSGINELVRPIQIQADPSDSSATQLIFDVSLPSSYSIHAATSNYNSSLQKLLIITPLDVVFKASVETSYGEVLESNAVTMRVTLPSIATGEWTLPDNAGNWDGSTISTATYFRIN